MKKCFKFLTAAALCGAMLLSGCGGEPSVSGKPYEFPADYVRTEAPTEPDFVIGDGTRGNIGNVKIESGDVFAVISVEGYGDITIKLFPELAPYTVQNFIEHAKNGNYDGRTFHRVIDDFMIQGNGAAGTDVDGGTFRNEINSDLRHFYGALCSASAFGNNSDQFYIVNSKTAQDNVFMQYFSMASKCSSSVSQCESFIESDEYKDNPDAIAYYEANKRFYSDSIDGIDAMIQTIGDEVNNKYAKGGVPSLDGGYTVFGQTVAGFAVIDKISKVETTFNQAGEKSMPVTDVKISTVRIFEAE